MGVLRLESVAVVPAMAREDCHRDGVGEIHRLHARDADPVELSAETGLCVGETTFFIAEDPGGLAPLCGGTRSQDASVLNFAIPPSACREPIDFGSVRKGAGQIARNLGSCEEVAAHARGLPGTVQPISCRLDKDQVLNAEVGTNADDEAHILATSRSA